MGILGAVHRSGGRGVGGGGQKGPTLPKICHTYPTMMKLGTVIPHVTHPLSSADVSNFLLEISKCCYIKKYRYRFHLDT